MMSGVMFMAMLFIVVGTLVISLWCVVRRWYAMQPKMQSTTMSSTSCNCTLDMPASLQVYVYTEQALADPVHLSPADISKPFLRDFLTQQVLTGNRGQVTIVTSKELMQAQPMQPLLTIQPERLIETAKWSSLANTGGLWIDARHVQPACFTAIQQCLAPLTSSASSSSIIRCQVCSHCVYVPPLRAGMMEAHQRAQDLVSVPDADNAASQIMSDSDLFSKKKAWMSLQQ
jgi:hypothetical protein